jgi:hypothetical protein
MPTIAYTLACETDRGATGEDPSLIRPMWLGAES